MAWDDKNYFWRCKDCKKFTLTSGHNYGYCSLYHGDIASNTICANFETPDGKRPRLCKLASDINKLAWALVFKEKNILGQEGFTFFRGHCLWKKKEDAFDACKAWLMEVE